MLREMEYDADSYEIKLEGSDAFEETSKRIFVLSAYLSSTYSSMRQQWQNGGRLPEDFASFLALHDYVFSQKERADIEDQVGLQQTKLFDTHPSGGDRIKRARRAGEPGVFSLEGSATELFSDFEVASKQVSALHYREDLGLQFDSTKMIPLFSFKYKLAEKFRTEGNLDEAARFIAEVMENRRRALGWEHRDTLRLLESLAVVRMDQGDVPEAVNLFSQTLGIQKRVLGNEDPDTLITMTCLGRAYAVQGKHSDAAMLLAEGLAIRRSKAGKAHPDTVASMYDLALVYDSQGEFEKAESLFREALPLCRALGDSASDQLSSLLATYGHTLLALRKYAEAEPFLRESLRMRQKTMPEDWRTFNVQNMLGGALAGKKQFEAAEPQLLQGYEGLKQQEEQLPPIYQYFLREAGERLVEFYEAWGRTETAERWKIAQSSTPEKTIRIADVPASPRVGL